MEIEVKVNELADIFSLALPDGLEYRDVLAEAHRQMAQVATQAAEDLLRNRVEESSDADDDWLFDDLGSLTEALSEACADSIECETDAATESLSEDPDDAAAGKRRWPTATEAVAVLPTFAPTAPPEARAHRRPARLRRTYWTV